MTHLDSNVLQVPGMDSSMPFPSQPAPPEVVKLSCENVQLRDELNETKAKLQMSLHDDRKRAEDSDVAVLWSKKTKRKRKHKRKTSKVRSTKFCEKITQTKEFYNPREYNSLKFKCKVYKEQCLDLRRKRIMLETCASKTAARLRAKSHQLSTLKSKHQKLKGSNAALAKEKQKLADKLVALGRECVSAEQRQSGVNAAKETQIEQLGNESKQLSILLSEKTAEVHMLRHAALDKMKQVYILLCRRYKMTNK